MKIWLGIRYWRPRIVVWVAGTAPSLIKVGSPCNARIRHRDVGKLLEYSKGNPIFDRPRNLLGNFWINHCRERVCNLDLINYRIRQLSEFRPGMGDEKNQRGSSGVNFKIKVVFRFGTVGRKEKFNTRVAGDVSIVGCHRAFDKLVVHAENDVNVSRVIEHLRFRYRTEARCFSHPVLNLYRLDFFPDGLIPFSIDCDFLADRFDVIR